MGNTIICCAIGSLKTGTDCFYKSWINRNAPPQVTSPCKNRGTTKYAGMVELVDSVDLGYTAKSVQVRVLLPAPKQYNPNQFFPIGDGFGLFIYFERYEQVYFPTGYRILPTSKPRGPRKKTKSI